MAHEQPQPAAVASEAPPQPATEYYGGFSRFELELEFVQCLGNPWYLNHLAAQKYLENPEFIAYLDYLQYFAQQKYAKYLTYPGPTLRALELLQHEQFRKDILIPDVVQKMLQEGFAASIERGS